LLDYIANVGIIEGFRVGDMETSVCCFSHL